MQIETDRAVSDFNPNEAEADKHNPYHGMLTLTIQSKGVDSHAPSVPRGPGRPPINDISIDDILETEDPVINPFKYYFHSQSERKYVLFFL